MDRVVIIGGDLILNLVLARLAAGQGHPVSILADNRAKSFFYDSYFASKAGGRYLQQIGLLSPNQAYKDADSVFEGVLQGLASLNLDVSYYGANCRFVDKSSEFPFFTVCPSHSKKNTTADTSISEALGVCFKPYVQYLPRFMKQVKFKNPIVVYTSTAPFIKNVSLSRSEGVLIQSFDVKRSYVTECARHQIEDLRGGKNIKSGYARYQEGIMGFLPWLSAYS